MFKKILPIVTLVALGSTASINSGQVKGEKASQQAKETCEKYVKAVLTKDVAAAMKLVATPWYDNLDGTDKGKISKNSDDVRKRLEKVVGDIPKVKEVSVEILDNLSYEDLLAKAGDRLKAEDRKMLDEVMKKTDRVVVARPTMDGKQGSRIFVLVGWRQRQAKVVGMREP